MKTTETLKQLAAAGVIAAALGTAPAVPAGTLGGHESHEDRVLASDTDTYSLWFTGDELAGVVVIGDGDTDLDLRVYDESGNLVASDTDWTDFCVVFWTPGRSGTFRIEIENLGDVYNAYILAVN